MSDELERRLRDAFAAQARGSVPDGRTPPPMRVPEHAVVGRSHRAARTGHRLAPLAAAAAVLIVVAGVFGLSRASSDHSDHRALGGPVGSHSVLPSSSQSVGSSSPAATSSRPANAVHVSTKISDGTEVGVGMPIIAFLSRPIVDAHGFAKATTVTVNGKRASGGWYFERKVQDPGHPIEADFRLPGYWPAHAKIHLALPVKGVSAGGGLTFDNDLSLDFSTGAANIVTVHAKRGEMTVVSDGKTWGTFRVSLGAPNTPTRRGTKVIMDKGNSVCMDGPGYHYCNVQYTQRLTYDGEYLLAAPWNRAHIVAGVNSSNGCTDLLTADAKKLYALLRIGDVVRYLDADGAPMSLGDGYGVWDVSWTLWRTGGLYKLG